MKTPTQCYQIHPTTELPVVITFGKSGYNATDWTEKWDRKTLNRMNEGLGVTPAEAEAMMVCSMTGNFENFETIVESVAVRI